MAGSVSSVYFFFFNIVWQRINEMIGPVVLQFLIWILWYFCQALFIVKLSLLFSGPFLVSRHVLIYKFRENHMI